MNSTTTSFTGDPRAIGMRVALVAILVWTMPASASQSVLPDTEITEAVETKLGYANGVYANDIDVETRDGVVTLAGTVESLFDKRRAVQVAQAIKGVRVIVDRLQIQSRPVADAEIRGDVLDTLRSSSMTGSYQVDCEVTNGIVTLTGTVDFPESKQIVERIAEDTLGVRGVRNDLVVKTEPNRPDGEIAGAVQDRLTWDAWLRGGMVNVAVHQGAVVLTGKVASAAEKSRATNDAWVPGVESVNDSSLEVDPSLLPEMERAGPMKRPSDEAVQKAIIRALQIDPRIGIVLPKVHVTTGIVMLTGPVRSLAARQAAMEDARDTVDVCWVEDLLKVRPSEPLADADIATAVRGTLAHKASLEGADIHVTVRAGRVTLTGVVDNNFERDRAALDAAEIKGVIEVVNRLRTLMAYSVVRKSDREFEWDIRRMLGWDPYLNQARLHIVVHNRVATLTGHVDSWQECALAERDAYSTGVREVINELKVD